MDHQLREMLSQDYIMYSYLKNIQNQYKRKLFLNLHVLMKTFRDTHVTV